MILDNLNGEDVRSFLYTSNRFLHQLMRYFATRKTDNGLFYAERHKNTQLLKAMWSIDEVDVNIQDEKGRTVLDIALNQVGCDKVMLHTLLNSPRVDVQRLLTRQMLMRSPEALRLILRFRNVDVSEEDSHHRTLLHVAIRDGGDDIAKSLALCAQSSAFEKVDDDGNTPLYWAIRRGYNEVMDIYWFCPCRSEVGFDASLQGFGTC
jgi:ankyrin repeat protein